MTPTVLHQRYRTARKTHRCDYGPCIIAPGERYEVSGQVSDGRAFTWKACAWHAAAARWIFAHSWGDYCYDGLSADAMVEELNELWGYAEVEIETYGRMFAMPFDWSVETT